jgi:signal transduction histidine kinase/ligand-binding sensor domain-containing protein
VNKQINITIFFHFIIFFGFAQKTNLAIQIFDNNSGFNSYNIKAIAQDKYGFIWVGTQDGVYFFDGRTFEKLINRQEYNQAKDVKKILYDSARNEMWVAYSTKGIEVFNCNTHEIGKRIILRNKADNSILQTIKNINFLDNDVFISSDEGLHVISLDDIQAQKVLIDPTFKKIDLKEIFYFKNFKYGVINNKGILKVSNKLFTNELFSFSSPIKSAVMINGCVYTTAPNNLSIYNITKNESVTLKTDFTINKIINWNNSILCVTSKGLYQLNSTNTFSKINVATNFSESVNDFAITAFADKEGNLWAGFSKSLALINPRPTAFVGYSKQKKNYEKLNHVYFALPINSEELLLGDLNGLLLLNKTNEKVELLDTTKITYCLSRIDSNRLFYSNSKGVFMVSNKDKKITPIQKAFFEWKKKSESPIRCFERINDSAFLLFQPIEGKLLFWDLKQSQISEIILDNSNKFTNNTIYAIRNITDSTVVICCEKSIIFYNYLNKNYSEKKYSHPISNEPLNFYFDALMVDQNILLASYGYGIIFLNKKYEISKIIDKYTGLSDNGVYRLLSDANNNVWVSTNNGLSQIDSRNNEINTYNTIDGLHGNMFEQYSGTKDNDELFFAGIDGVTNIFPTNIASNKKIPEIYITEVGFYSKSNVINSVSIDNKKIFIRNNVDQVTISLASNCFNGTYKNKFFYKIDNINESWVSLGSKNEITLLGLMPGTYKLHIKTSNSSGFFNLGDKIIILEVEPKWYQTWWFYLLIALTVAAILYALYRYRITQIKKQHAIRKNIATDLHDDLGSTLNSVKVFTNLAISGVKQEESLQQVKDNLTEATMSLRDMIWVLDDSLDTVDELVTRLKQFAIPVASASNFEAIIKADSEVNNRQLTKEEKRNLFLICKEAINNSIKYSGATQIDVSITANGKKIQIVVADNGKGFNVDEVKKGYGLKNMQYRAKQIKFNVILTSSAAGTQINIQPL